MENSPCLANNNITNDPSLFTNFTTALINSLVCLSLAWTDSDKQTANQIDSNDTMHKQHMLSTARGYHMNTIIVNSGIQ